MKRYILRSSLDLFADTGHPICCLRKGTLVYVSGIGSEKTKILRPKRGWVDSTSFILKAEETNFTEVKKTKTKENPIREANVQTHAYYKSSKTVNLYGNGKKIGELFPNSTMYVKKVEKSGFVTISWPVGAAQVPIASLETLVPNDCRLGTFSNKEDMVKFLDSYLGGDFCSPDIIFFVQRFFRQECNQDLIFDLSYNPNSQISRLCTHPGVEDFREFHVTKRCAIFINLPWFYKTSVSSCVKRLLQEANEKNVIVDVLVLQNAGNAKALKLADSATATWIGKNDFTNPSSKKVTKREVFTGYFTNRASLIKSRAEDLHEFRNLNLK